MESQVEPGCHSHEQTEAKAVASQCYIMQVAVGLERAQINLAEALQKLKQAQENDEKGGVGGPEL